MNDNQVSETKEFVKDLAGSTVEVGTSLVIENLPEFGAEVAGIIGNEAIGACTNFNWRIVGGCCSIFVRS